MERKAVTCHENGRDSTYPAACLPLRWRCSNPEAVIFDGERANRVMKEEV